MKVCENCKVAFKPKGRQRICNECKEIENAMRERVQAKDTKQKPEKEAQPIRPLDRFGKNRLVLPGQMGVRIIRRGT